MAAGICGKRLQPILADMVASLERHQELKLDQETKEATLAVSPATIDRLLRPFKSSQRRGQSTTKPGGLLKQQIPYAPLLTGMRPKLVL
ncbi:MAG: hypothetical protein R3D55_00685 [Chloroflexota bacterium]